MKNEFTNNTIMSNRDHFESEINRRLDTATKAINNIGMENIKDADNRMMNMINSRSKGNPINVSQMMGCVGQQSVEGKRVIEKVVGAENEGKQWELTDRLVGDGVYKACITLGCCSQLRSGWQSEASKMI